MSTLQQAMVPLPGHPDGALHAAALAHMGKLRARGLLPSDDLALFALARLASAADQTPGGDAAAKLAAELLEELANLPTDEPDDDALDELLAAAIARVREEIL